MTAPALTEQEHDPLIERTRLSLSLSATHKPDVYFQTGSGLYVEEAFRNRVARLARPVPKGTTFAIGIAYVRLRASDQEIEHSLPEDHAFDPSAACAVIATLLERQKQGGSGELVANTYANLLYTPYCVVDLHWGPFLRRWRVRVWRRGQMDKWRDGSRVLFPSARQ
jgi:hypothetical protein